MFKVQKSCRAPDGPLSQDHFVFLPARGDVLHFDKGADQARLESCCYIS